MTDPAQGTPSTAGGRGDARSDDDGRTAGGLESTALEVGTLVRMWGDVDASLRGQASGVMAHVMARPGPVIIDASAVEFLDSTGVAFILQLVRAGEEDGRRVVLRDPPVLVLEVFDLIGLGGTVPLEFTAG